MRRRSTATTDHEGRADPRRYSRAALFGVIAAREAWRDAGLRAGEPRRRRPHRQRRRRHRRRRAAVSGLLHHRRPPRDAVRDRRRHLRHGVERDFDLARTARPEPRPVVRLHELHRRHRLRRVAHPLRRARRDPVGRHRRLRAAGHDLRLLADARRLDALQRSAGGGVAAVRSRPRRIRARRRRLDAGARARGSRAARAAPPATRAIEGYASTCDAYHRVQMDPDGDEIVRCIETALAKAQRRPEEIGYINYHGTSTQLNDAIESRCVRRVFGRHADRGAGIVDQVDDRPSAGRERRGGRGRDGAGDDARPAAADDQSRRSRPGVRHGLHPEHRAPPPTSTPRCATAWASDRRTARWCSDECDDANAEFRMQNSDSCPCLHSAFCILNSTSRRRRRAGRQRRGAVSSRAPALRVRLVDRATFPRDKLCGDTLNPGLRSRCLARLGPPRSAIARASARG